MRKPSLATQVFIGFALGIILGLVFKEDVLILKPLGDIFLNLIKMLVAPLIFFSVVSSISSLESMAQLKKMGGKVMGFYIGTMIICALLGLTVANLIEPGKGFTISSIIADASVVPAAPASMNFAETLVNMIPTNPFNALSQTNLIQIIIFSLFLGLAMTALGDESSTMKRIFHEGASIMYKITSYVMAVSPLGVMALMACTIGQYGLEIFGPLGKFLLALYTGGLVVLVLLYVPMLKFIGKMPLRLFFRHIGKVAIMSMSTTSSAGTMPLSLSTAKNDFKVHPELADFAIPLGAAINMNGAVLYYSMAVTFVSQIYGMGLGFDQQFYLVVLAAIIALGSPGIPGGGIVMTMVLLTFMGLPLEIMGLIAGVYRLFDMLNTTLNIIGDIVGTVCVARLDDMIDLPE